MQQPRVVAPLAEPGEQHRDRADQRRRIGLVLPGDVGRRAVLRLRHRVIGAGIDRRREPEAAGNLGGFVGQDVAEHVGGDDHVERAGVAHQQRRHRVDDLLLAFDLRIARRDRARAFEEQPVGDAQHVRLVHDGDVLAPLHAPAETLPRRCAVEACRVILRTASATIRRRHELAAALEHVAVGVEAFGVLAHHHEIDRLAAARREIRARLRRADVGEQVEPLAQRAGRVDAAFVGRRIVVVRDRPEDHAVGGLRRLEARLGKRRALRGQRLQPDLDLIECEFDLPFRGRGAQHAERRRGDLGRRCRRRA